MPGARRRHRRAVVPGAVAVLVALAPALPAAAHPTLDLAQVPAETATQLVLHVPLERPAGDDPGPGNDVVRVRLPPGWELRDCTRADGWECGGEPAESGTLVTFDRGEEGDPSATRFELEVVAVGAPDDQVTLPTVQTYVDELEVGWIGEDPELPAPTLVVGAPGSAAQPAAASPAPHEVVVAETAREADRAGALVALLYMAVLAALAVGGYKAVTRRNPGAEPDADDADADADEDDDGPGTDERPRRAWRTRERT